MKREAAALLVLLPVAIAALVGGRGPGRIELNLGPGDSPYIEGFLPYYEVDGDERTHWTTYDARIVLPIRLHGGPVTLTYRFARDFPQTAEVEILLGGRVVDRFRARGGVFQTREVRLASLDEDPIEISIRADSHERRNMGLKLDWVRLDYGERAKARLRGTSAFRPALLALVVFATFRALGWSPWLAALFASPLTIGLTIGLWSRPFFTHRFLTGTLVAAIVYALAALGIGAALVRSGRVSPASRRIVTTLAFAAFLVRALFVSHPDFYYPDLRTHATLVETVREAGLDFFVSPARHIESHGKWVAEAYGRVYAFPYTPAFHLPFALLDVPYDAVITWMKLAAAALSTVPLVLVWAMARALALPPWGSALMLLVPTYTSRLSFAFLPSLFGHAVDTAFVFWILTRLERIGEPRCWVWGAALVAACELAYVSGVLNVSVFLSVLAAMLLLRRGEGSARRASLLLGMLAAGSLAAFAAFYRDFLGMVWDVVSRIGGAGQGAESAYEVQGFVEVAYRRTRSFFDGIYPLLTAIGFGILVAGAKGAVLWAWLMAYLVLLFGRARFPDIFLHGHETLFVTPLVCLLSGAVLGQLWTRGGPRRWVALALLLVLAVQGFHFQWDSISNQLLTVSSE